jgi:hypothetical protein
MAGAASRITGTKGGALSVLGGLAAGTRSLQQGVELLR